MVNGSDERLIQTIRKSFSEDLYIKLESYEPNIEIIEKKIKKGEHKDWRGTSRKDWKHREKEKRKKKTSIQFKEILRIMMIRLGERSSG